MAFPSHSHRLPAFLFLVVFSMICSSVYSNDPHSSSALPPFHHHDKPLPRHNPSLPPRSHDKPSPIPIHKPPQDHVKPPAYPPHPLDFGHHPSPLISKLHPPLGEQHQPPKPVHDGRHPSPPPRALNNIDVHHPQVVPLNPRVHTTPAAAPHYQSPIGEHRLPSPLHPRTPPRKMQIATPLNHNNMKPVRPSHSPHFYKSPPTHDRHGGIHTAPPPIHH